MPKVKRVDGKKVLINILIILFLSVVVVLVSYGCHVVDLLSPVSPAREDLVGRMYGNVDADVFLLLETDRTVLSMDGEEKTFQSFEYVDGIITIKENVDETTDEEEERVYTFILIEGDRVFFKEQNVYMELVWVSVIKSEN